MAWAIDMSMVPLDFSFFDLLMQCVSRMGRCLMRSAQVPMMRYGGFCASNS